MSYSEFLGFASGLGFGIVLAMALYLWKGRRVSQDERTAMVHTKAGQWGFYASAALVFLLWVAENLRVGQEQGEVQFFSPLGIAFWSMIAIYLMAVIYHQWASSGSVLAGNTEKQRMLGFVLAANTVTMSGLSRSVPAFLYVQAAMCLAAIYLIYISRRAGAAR